MCVSACPNRAFDFGLLSELQERYGNKRELEDMPSGKETEPSVVFKSHRNKKQLVSYNSEKAIKLLMKRDPLPKVFESIDDIINIPEGIVGRSKLVIKHESADDLMSRTRNDES